MKAFPIIGQNEDSCETSCASESAGHSSAESGALIAERGFCGNAAVVTLGCAKNTVDSEVMLGALKSRGYRIIVDPSDADLVIVNTCAFLTSAVEESLERILEISELKKAGRLRKLLVAGCMVERYRQDLERELPEVDRFISTDELLTVADDNTTTNDCFSEARRPYFLYDEKMPRMRSTAGHTAYVKIAEGCDRPCSFCIIPKIRGTFRSRPLASVVSEIDQLVDEGVREINLVAQDLTAYGNDFDRKSGTSANLLQLLRELGVHSRGRQFWTRLLYAYPIGVTEELIREITSSPVICNYLDLPLQHISGPVLKAMNRPLGERGTRGLIEQIRTVGPEIALRTTFITGFPGETEEDVEALAQFIREGHFRHVGVFTYSQEAEAKSFTLPNQVEEAEKLRRRDYLMSCQKETLDAHLRQFIGKQLSVLVEGTHRDTDLLLVGRAEWQAPEVDGEVIINEFDESIAVSAANLVGQFCEVVISDTAGYDLIGTLKSQSE